MARPPLDRRMSKTRNPSLQLEEGGEVDGSWIPDVGFSLQRTKRASHSTSSSSKQPRNKRRKHGQGMEITALASELGKLSSIMQSVKEDIRELTSCFKDERDIVEKRSKIYEELSKIEGLTDDDRFAIGRKIIKDNNEVRIPGMVFSGAFESSGVSSVAESRVSHLGPWRNEAEIHRGLFMMSSGLLQSCLQKQQLMTRNAIHCWILVKVLIIPSDGTRKQDVLTICLAIWYVHRCFFCVWMVLILTHNCYCIY
ncbi:uncharacterized protein [Elaeis guineensis]|uniref:uncharacterized protein n=1 Tax=Elaeis guineensis var. tenera TaxID=51953 RepID=UPI003C6D0A48